jgi:type I restriction enzyme, R subunit
MESNFSFLQQEFSPFFATAQRAEQHTWVDPMYAAILCRKSLEEFIKWLYDNDKDLEIPADTTLNSLIHESSFQELIPKTLFQNINLIRKIGNNAAHSTSTTTPKESITSIKILHDFTLWVVRLYSRSQTPVIVFDEELLPTGSPVDRNRRQMEQLAVQYEETRQQLQRANEELLRNQALAEQLQERLATVSFVKAENLNKVEVQHPTSSLSERDTRKVYIDAMLKEAGWDVDAKNVRELELQYIHDVESSRFADYVVWGDDGKPLGVVEAKRTMVDAYKGKRQAEIYADSLEKTYGQRPIIFFTNGYETYIWDDQFYPYRPVQGFYSKEELELLINRRALRKPLAEQQINKEITSRYYQEEAIKRVTEDLEKRRRGALLVMATGSGKTRTAAAIVDVLTKSNWAKRILFLADRNALVTQAKNAFNTYLPHLTSIDLTRESEDVSSRIVFSTYPTMMNRIDNTKVEGQRYFGVGHFDVVIIDEAHRSIYEKYKALFSYFDAIYIGLTATPKAETHRDTYDLFGLETHNPTYAYELDKAVADGYLRPPIAVKVPLKFPRQGVKYNDLTDEEKAEYEREFLETYGHIPNEVSSSAVNTWLFNEDTANRVLKLLMEQGIKIEGGDKIGKTIIFAKNHDHAVFIERCFDNLYPHYAGKMLKLIDNQVYEPQTLIYEFSDPEKTDFQIAVSVDMLDTGIDIPEVLNLVAFRPIRSKAKWWQMIGRGTRLRENIFGPGLHKEFFYLFDICGNIEFFESNIQETEPPIAGSLSEQVFKAKLNLLFLLQTRASTEEDENLKDELLNELHSIVADFSTDDFRVRMKMQYVDKYRQKEAWNNFSQLEVLEIEKHLAPLYADDGSNEAARRFDLLYLNYMLAKMQGLPREGSYQINIQDSVRGLLRKMGIPSVKSKEALINYLLEDDYWNDASYYRHHQTRIELRNLIQYIDWQPRQNLYTNFEDEMGEVTYTEMIHSYQELASYKRRVEKFIRDNKNHITIHRICNNKPISRPELDELEKLLFRIDIISKEKLDQITGRQPLAKFIRSILGLDVNAAKEAFSQFLDGQQLNATQLHFINTIIDYLAVNGTIEKRMLFDKPFTDINDQGLAGVFEMEKAGAIVRIVDSINKNAMEVI